MTHPSNTSVTAQFGAGERGEPFTPRDAWDELVHKDDRTSPEDYPDMCLITFEELRDFMDRAAPVSHTSVKDGGGDVGGPFERIPAEKLARHFGVTIEQVQAAEDDLGFMYRQLAIGSDAVADGARIALAQRALETAAARFNLLAGVGLVNVGLVNGADPKVGYRECMEAIAALRSAPVKAVGSEALRLLAAEDARQEKLHELLETIREQIRLGVEPEHRPDGLFQNIQDAVYAMRGRTLLMNDVAITAALAHPGSGDAEPGR